MMQGTSKYVKPDIKVYPVKVEIICSSYVPKGKGERPPGWDNKGDDWVPPGHRNKLWGDD